MENKKINIGLSDVILIVVSVAFLVTSLTVFTPCKEPMENGMWMSCHWAGHAVSGVSAVLVVLALVHTFMADAKVKMGVGISMIPVALLAAVIPNNLISLCKMNTMRCHSVMTPGTIVMSVVVIVAAIFDLVVQIKKSKGAKRE